MQLDVFGDQSPQHHTDPLDEIVDVELARLEHGLAAEQQQLPRELRRPLTRVADRGELVPRRIGLVADP